MADAVARHRDSGPVDSTAGEFANFPALS